MNPADDQQFTTLTRSAEMDAKILRTNEEIVVELNNDLDSFQEDIKKQKDDLKLLKQKQRDNIAKVKRLVNERRNKTTSMETEIEKILTKHKVAIQVYSHLRIVNSKEAELKRTDEVIKDMHSLWKLMNLPETHKVHLLFAHAAIDQRCSGGFGDKDEEWVEKLHQDKKL